VFDQLKLAPSQKAQLKKQLRALGEKFKYCGYILKDFTITTCEFIELDSFLYPRVVCSCITTSGRIVEVEIILD
jgi:hypothetical protein